MVDANEMGLLRAHYQVFTSARSRMKVAEYIIAETKEGSPDYFRASPKKRHSEARVSQDKD